MQKIYNNQAEGRGKREPARCELKAGRHWQAARLENLCTYSAQFVATQIFNRFWHLHKIFVKILHNFFQAAKTA